MHIRFKDLHGLGAPYIFVHPHKQLAVKHLVDNKPPWVDCIIIFGSALGDHHFYKKDLDVCIIGENFDKDEPFQYQRHLRLPGIRYDFLTYDTIHDIIDENAPLGSVERRISEGGLVVYAKNRHIA